MNAGRTIAYPSQRKRVGPTGSYKLDTLGRDIVGVLQNLHLWSNSEIGRAFGVDRSCVLRHGRRMAGRSL